MHKVCTKCHISKDMAFFSKSKNSKDGHMYFCKECDAERNSEWQTGNPEKRRARNRNWVANNPEQIKAHNKKNYAKNPGRHRNRHLIYHYGIDLNQYNEMLSNQNSCCAICGIKDETLLRSLSVDHCHSTGVVRGLLCTNCNQGIGHLKDDPVLCLKAAEYLRSFTKEEKTA